MSAEPQSTEAAVAEMLDRILASAENMTRTMLVEWLRREREALAHGR